MAKNLSERKQNTSEQSILLEKLKNKKKNSYSIVNYKNFKEEKEEKGE
jgi:hypothetical protein